MIRGRHHCRQLQHSWSTLGDQRLTELTLNWKAVQQIVVERTLLFIANNIDFAQIHTREDIIRNTIIIIWRQVFLSRFLLPFVITFFPFILTDLIWYFAYNVPSLPISLAVCCSIYCRAATGLCHSLGTTYLGVAGSLSESASVYD